MACSVAAARTWHRERLAAVEQAGLRPIMVDLTSFAVLRAVADADHLRHGIAQAEALVDIGARVTNIVVHHGGVPRFVRILLMGGQDVTDAIASSLGVTHEQAEAVKQQLGLGAPEGMDSQAALRVVEAVSAAFVDEVRGSLDYYSHPAAPPRSHVSFSPVAVPDWAGWLSGYRSRPECRSSSARR